MRNSSSGSIQGQPVGAVRQLPEQQPIDRPFRQVAGYPPLVQRQRFLVVGERVVRLALRLKQRPQVDVRPRQSRVEPERERQLGVSGIQVAQQEVGPAERVVGGGAVRLQRLASYAFRALMALWAEVFSRSYLPPVRGETSHSGHWRDYNVIPITIQPVCKRPSHAGAWYDAGRPGQISSACRAVSAAR